MDGYLLLNYNLVDIDRLFNNWSYYFEIINWLIFYRLDYYLPIHDYHGLLYGAWAFYFYRAWIYNLTLGPAINRSLVFNFRYQAYSQQPYIQVLSHCSWVWSEFRNKYSFAIQSLGHNIQHNLFLIDKASDVL